MTEPTDEARAEVPDLEIRPGLRLLFDTFVAPRRAFATVAVTGQWIPAALVVLALVIFSTVVLVAPAWTHVVLQRALAVAHSAPLPSYDRLLREDRFGLALGNVAELFFMWVWTALILSTVSRQGPRAFGIYFALAVNVTLPLALETLLVGIGIAAHPAAGYRTDAQLSLAFPDSLAVLRPDGNAKELAFLSAFSVFQVWNSLLLAYGLRQIGGVRLLPAVITAFTVALAFALLQVAVPL